MNNKDQVYNLEGKKNVKNVVNLDFKCLLLENK